MHAMHAMLPGCSWSGAAAKLGSQLRAASSVLIGNRLGDPASFTSCSTAQHKHCGHEGTGPAADAAEPNDHCWRCDFRVQKGGLVCKACDSIQPGHPKTSYFELFNTPAGEFDINPGQLEKTYKDLQWHLHPDKAVRKSRFEQMYAAEHAAMINDAYSVLKDPLSRANYILSQAGLLSDDDERQTITDQQLLVEVMEAREQVEETDNQLELKAIHQSVASSYAQLISKLSSAFRSRDFEYAKQLTVQLRYIAKLLEEINKKLPSF